MNDKDKCGRCGKKIDFSITTIPTVLDFETRERGSQDRECRILCKGCTNDIVDIIDNG